MVSEARCQTTRTEGTADIDIKAGLEEKGAEIADLDRFFNGSGEDQGICAGQRVNHNGKSYFIMKLETNRGLPCALCYGPLRGCNGR